MRQSAHKDIPNFLHEVIRGSSQGQFSRRICLIQACIHCRLERLSEPTEACRTEKSPVCPAGHKCSPKQNAAREHL